MIDIKDSLKKLEIELLGDIDIHSLTGHRFTLHRSIAEKFGIIRPHAPVPDIYRLAAPDSLARILAAENIETLRIISERRGRR